MKNPFKKKKIKSIDPLAIPIKITVLVEAAQSFEKLNENHLTLLLGSPLNHLSDYSSIFNILESVDDNKRLLNDLIGVPIEGYLHTLHGYADILTRLLFVLDSLTTPKKLKKQR